MMIPISIDITDRQGLNKLLTPLHSETPAKWGRLKPQNMIEHLTEAVEYTNGKRIAILTVSEEEATRQKKSKVNFDFVIPRFAKGFLPDATEHVRCADLPSAIRELYRELDAFEFYFQTEGRTAIHPGFGPMDHKEWLLWHGKHFAHHFIQFGLMKSDS
jgi:hypothetical protein